MTSTFECPRGGSPFLVLAAALVPLLSCGQGLITTVAGSTGVFPPAVNGGPAINAPLASVSGVAVDSAGNIFVADSQDNMVAKIAPDGLLTVIAGNRGVGFSGDGGLAVRAQLDNPGSLAVDAAGNLYIAVLDRIRKVTPAGIISTVAGNGQSGFSGDGGPATSAQLSGLGGVAAAIAVDSAGNLYIADSGNYRIRQVRPDGTIRTIAGTGQLGFSGDDGPATGAQFNFPDGIAVDGAGDLYIADTGNNRVRKVAPGGIISTVAGSGQPVSSAGFSGDGGPAINAQLDYPMGLAVDAMGNVYIADSGNSRIRKVAPGGAISTVARGGQPGSFAGFSGDGGAAIHAVLNRPVAVSMDASGDLYIADSMNSRIREITPAGIIGTVAGNGGVFLGDGGPAASAELTHVNGVTTDLPGNLYIADGGNNRVRRVTPDGTIGTVAGNGQSGFSGDGGPAASAQLFDPLAVTMDSAGNLFVADAGNNRIRKVTPAGTISTVAGIAQLVSYGGFSGDGGPAISAGLSEPEGLAVDAAGNLYIADFGNNRIRKVTPGGIISTVAGNGQAGFSGDGGPAINAQLNNPTGVAVDAAGNLYIADFRNHSIRKVDTTGTISTVAGNQQGSFSGDGGPATLAALCFPRAVAVDAAGRLYITDSGNNRIRKVDTKGTISTVAGNGAADFSGDSGPSTCAALQLNYNDYDKVGGGAALDAAGNLYIADWLNQRVRKVTPPALPCLSAAVNSASYLIGSSSPGSLVSLFGYDLTADGQSSAVTVNNISAPLLYVSSTLINAQVPFETALGTLPIEVSRGIGGNATSSLIVAAASPGIFTMNVSGSSQGAIVTSTGEVAAPAGSLSGQSARPARRGELISIFLTGLGDVTNRPPIGAPARIPPPFSETILKAAVSIGGVSATPSFAGLAPLFVGLYQENVLVPDKAPTGDAIQVVLSIGGTVSNSVTIAVQ